MPNLAISLHATTEAQRVAIVPPAKKYSLQDIIEACRRFPLSRRGRITFEYVLLAGVNDSLDDARRLARLLTGRMPDDELVVGAESEELTAFENQQAAEKRS